MGSIFVSIPSYRDPECQWTVKDLFEKASNPDNIFVGICWQFDTDPTSNADSHCFQLETRPTQVRTYNMDWKEARGPCLARYHAQQLWNGEEYHLQIDSHMRFVQNWDRKLIDFLSQCPSDKPILTTYPADYQLPSRISTEKNPPFVVFKGFGNDGVMRMKGSLLARCHSKPLKQLFWVAGFAFSKAQVLNEVGYDKDLPFLFFGEEMSMNVRLWTSGWDFYAPGENIVYHLWDRSYRPQFRELQIAGMQEMQRRSLLKVKKMLNMLKEEELDESREIDVSTCGLGSMRTLKEWEIFTGVHLLTQTVEEKAKLGGLTKEWFMDNLLDIISKSNQIEKNATNDDSDMHVEAINQRQQLDRRCEGLRIFVYHYLCKH